MRLREKATPYGRPLKAEAAPSTKYLELSCFGRRTTTLYFPGKLMAGRTSTPFRHQEAKLSCSLPATSKSRRSALLLITRTSSMLRISRTSTVATSGRGQRQDDNRSASQLAPALRLLPC